MIARKFRNILEDVFRRIEHGFHLLVKLIFNELRKKFYVEYFKGHMFYITFSRHQLSIPSFDIHKLNEDFNAILEE